MTLTTPDSPLPLHDNHRPLYISPIVCCTYWHHEVPSRKVYLCVTVKNGIVLDNTAAEKYMWVYCFSTPTATLGRALSQGMQFQAVYCPSVTELAWSQQMFWIWKHIDQAPSTVLVLYVGNLESQIRANPLLSGVEVNISI